MLFLGVSHTIIIAQPVLTDNYTYAIIQTMSELSELNKHPDVEPIVAITSQEVIADPNTAWHATRGFDFAGVEAMLEDGLVPADNQQDNAVCMSSSPSLTWSIGREANSFYAYTLRGGISLAIRQGSPQYPTGNHGGFVDEIRQPAVAANAVYGVMLPEKSLDTPLSEVVESHEPRKPLKAREYLERTVQHIQILGGQIDTDTAAMVTTAIQATEAGDYVERELTARIDAAFMSAYSAALSERYGLTDPKVSDLLAVIFRRVGKRPEVFTYSEDQKKEIGTANARMAVKNQSGRIGSFGVTSAFSSW